jgi:hypothetical protein
MILLDGTYGAAQVGFAQQDQIVERLTDSPNRAVGRRGTRAKPSFPLL